MVLMLVKDTSKLTQSENTPFESVPFSMEAKPFTREDLTNLWNMISSYDISEKINWVCPTCKENIVTTINGKGSCFGCSSHWIVRPKLTLLRGEGIYE